jgi:PAS domain S-box-containing protein
MTDPLHVLLVEDDPGHIELALRAFEGRGAAFRVTVAETIGAGRAALHGEESPDIVIADWLLPDGEGLDLLRGESAAAMPPVVIMASHGSERVAVEAMRAGAADYVVKNELALADLPHMAERAVRQRRIEEALSDLVAGTAASGGQALFGELALRLARTLRVKYASVAELAAPGRIRTLARCIDGRLVANVEYELVDTPCGGVLDGTVRLVHIPDGVAEAYPADSDLRLLGARSYVGTALRASSGAVLGLINAIHDRPLGDTVRPEPVLQAFAARAAAELERLRAERELERERIFADSLLDMVASLVIVVDAHGRIVRFNRACEQASGWSEEEVRGRELWEVLREPEGREQLARHRREGRSVLELPVGFESEWLTRSGERRLISWINRPVHDEAGAATYLIGTGTDVTERRRLEADLRRVAIEWREAFDGLPLGVLVVDPEGRVVRVNRTVAECSGRAWSDLIDRPLATLAPGEPWAALCELVEQVRRGGTTPAHEVSDPLTRRTWVVSARVLAAEGEFSGRMVLNFQDVTETVRLKEQLRQSETMAEIGSIVAGVAHEVRNPLFSISATLDAFEARFRGAGAYDRYLDVLRGEIVRLTTLMKELLAFGRPSRPDFAECRMEEVVEAAVAACAPLAGRKPVEIAWHGCDGLPPVLADRVRITQVLQNLIENALHFSPPGGRVELALRTTEQEGARYVEVTVKDSGPGFEPNDLSRMFEPFFTRRRGGTGLGLSIVKRFVYDHGGEVTAANHPEGGAIVKVRLRGAV